jgi:hypothetical protein
MMSTNGQPHEAHDLQEVANVPAKGQIVIRMQFTNYTGKTVLHCYILNHEVGHDGGPTDCRVISSTAAITNSGGVVFD